MVVPNQDGVPDCRAFNVSGTISGRSPGRTEVVLVDGSVRDTDLPPITTPLPSDEVAKILAETLDGLKTEYDNYRKRAQTNLRAYVTDKSYPLDERFEVWTKWCKKKVHDWVIGAEEVPLFGKVVEDHGCDLFDRYVDYGWRHFLHLFKDTYDTLQEKHDVTMDDVKEALIETNFGSFTMDW